jgi:adenylosuccinate synthase
MPYHKLMDALNEKALGDKEIGTPSAVSAPAIQTKQNVSEFGFVIY